MTEIYLEEYKMLREEMQNCVERDNSLATFMVTAVSTILTFAVSFNLQVPFLFLISFCIIIPFSARISHYKGNLARISSYLIYYIEPKLGIDWETKNMQGKLPRGFFSRLIISMRNYVGFWLGIISFVIYIVEYINKVGLNGSLDFIFCFSPIFLVLITFLIDKEIDSIVKSRKTWLHIWEQLDNSEQQQKSTH